MDFQLSVMGLRHLLNWELKTIVLWHKYSRYPELYTFTRYGNIYGTEIHIFSFLAINSCGDKMLCECNYCIIKMFFINEEKST